ncbi:esterase/lipase family protein [Ferrimonas balearica]|uniref:esterase/lipase family protein n=1 Tax=Ferrimonas balearica TaxID=44012 RepID=UPI001C993360|nr:hypothetical protein [Ferrimonas balearica]MBY5993523.1 hypothetical protein [Ferrimonas balearica]
MTDKVILLHGLYMHELVMWPLARRLNRLGWQTECLSYNSLNIDTEVLFQRLVAALPEGPAYMVGHSLGGVLLHRFAQQHPLPADSRVVTLGSPLQGALLADRLASWHLGGVIGNAGHNGLFTDGPRQWTAAAQLGSLAGNAGFGFGQLLGGMPADTEHDGTVLLPETRIEGMADHVVLPVTHTSMLLAEGVARQTDHFLRQGQFQAQAG